MNGITVPVQFAHPAIFAAGLACVAVPILVHLLTRRRRRIVRWGAMRFLLEAYRKQKRRLQLEQLILLLLRCLLVALIAAAVAGPFVGAGDASGGSRTLVIVLDDSLTSGVLDESGRSSLERHKARAVELVGALDASRGDTVGLLTLGAPAQAVVMPPSSDLAGVVRVIERVKPTQAAADWAGVRSELDAWVRDESVLPDVVVCSDVLEGTVPIERPLEPLARPVRLRVDSPRQAGLTNVAVADVQPPRSLLVVSALSPADLASPLRVRLIRSGPGVSEGAITTVIAWMDSAAAGRQVSREIGRTTVRWAPGATQAEGAVSVRPGALEGIDTLGILRVEIDQDALPDDNRARVPVELRQKLRVGIVAPARFGRDVEVGQFESADWVRLALAPADDQAGGMDIIALQPGSLDRPRLAGLDAVIVLRPDLLTEPAWDVLAQTARDGGIVIIAPAAEAVLHTWGDSVRRAFGVPWTIAREPTLLGRETELAEPATSDAGSVLRVLAGELSYLVRSVHVTQVLSVQAPEPDVVLRSAAGEPFLLIARPADARGLVALFTSGIDTRWTDLPTKPMMVPLFQELVRQGVARGAAGITMFAGGVPSLDARVAELEPVESGPAIRITDAQPPAIRTAGLWRARDAEGVMRGWLVVNADPAGSGTGTRALPQLEHWFSTLAGGPVVFSDSSQLAPASVGRRAATDEAGAGFGQIAFVLAFLLGVVEMYLARWASHADASASAGGGA